MMRESRPRRLKREKLLRMICALNMCGGDGGGRLVGGGYGERPWMEYDMKARPQYGRGKKRKKKCGSEKRREQQARP
jgi:hypothetical protein